MTLPSLRESLEAHGLMAKKSFGQHFLLDLNVTRKIVRLGQDDGNSFDGQVVIEVGPGPGGLTRAALESEAAYVLAVEKDSRFIELLSELDTAYPDRFGVVEADALKVDEPALLAERGLPPQAHLVSNLPYNVGTPLLIKWLTGPWQPKSLTLMFQLEVALRVVAPVGDDDYGRLGVISQVLCDCEKLMDLPARAFTPPPKVDSAVVRLIPKTQRPAPNIIRNLEMITAAAFGQRRKMLRASLKGLGGEALLAKVGIEPTLRAENITPAEFLRLAEAL
ncbi:16S rRNA (adenine(1518)-N(6)/adenine(1519)-N(6)) -dimethyltransferase RsmA [Asticcacaulis sp. DW145]|uniref:Ribosomal RNA small subunit methyltransferase A n=1 Tax=Asticcacaulis currens TaxID=2984210 RepID=A0ABT5IJ59_9CAUL|nr:16S rRNA (adenine(1518)-N(6)/adenine(1519)-N(6))-dimethyltransferase RsmA [Asticcacaulis currens]MDC7695905.1 16S rRNA (adenine(1518)-N(6)/adenine(1519)-N(6))-dimethyltransferase RsmA [Asticcacaulis currens]BEV12543.1 16S rRNA (adenine(1518)-N(6)/adenine(1519)-N(6)) -dimethyltransferase RsmA [Asticcacaulis sp. DW145]